MSFKHFISPKIIKSQLSRKDCIAKLNIYHSEFKNLDSVTLSRWLNGRTVPSLYKQILLCNFFEYNLMDFIKNKHFQVLNEGKKTSEIYLNEMNNIQSSIANISYVYSRDSIPTYQLNIYTKDEYRKRFLLFYLNFDLYKQLFNMIDNLSVDPITLTFEEIKDNSISSHGSISYIEKKNKIYFCDFFDIKLNETEDFWLSNIGYRTSNEAFLISFSAMIYFLYHQKKEFYLSLIRSERSFHSLSEIGYEQIGKTIFDHGEKIYLAKCNILRVLSNSYAINQISEILNKYDIDSFFSREIKDEYFKR
ncbi:hypothetical protein [Photobacterium damselae]|uniref:hypothetical protein n=1 Tax=Photobacterium damselae TaxID=38293 RepID=UPI0015939AA6|nr:hypothetical protein [Photobacterium damselae]NVH48432.1 hypothetical protein [Photobacterium damselae subsp. damselae]